MPPVPEPVLLDLADFDAVGIASQIVVALRSHAIVAGTQAVATVAPPPGWHTLRLSATRTGHIQLAVRSSELSPSRWHNVLRDLVGRAADWLRDDDGEGLTCQYPPGTEPMTVAFEVLAAITVAGAPADVRQVTAVDRAGEPVPLL